MVLACGCLQDPQQCPAGGAAAERPCRAAGVSPSAGLGLAKLQIASARLASSGLSSIGLMGIW